LKFLEEVKVKDVIVSMQVLRRKSLFFQYGKYIISVFLKQIFFWVHGKLCNQLAQLILNQSSRKDWPLIDSDSLKVLALKWYSLWIHSITLFALILCLLCWHTNDELILLGFLLFNIKIVKSRSDKPEVKARIFALLKSNYDKIIITFSCPRYWYHKIE